MSRLPWVSRSELVRAQAKMDDALSQVLDLRLENNRLRRELTEVSERVRLEDSIFRYLEIKGVELLK